MTCLCAPLGNFRTTPYQARLRAASRGFGALGASAKVTGAASGASTGATVGSVVPVVGTAIGAVVGAVAGALFSKKKDPNAAEKQALMGQLDDWQRTAGQIPGRAFNLLVLKQLIDGAGQRGMWPNIKKWSGDAITGAIDGCKGCTPPTIREFVAQQVAAGDDNPFSLASKFTNLVKSSWGSKWFVADAGPTQKQLMVDLMDYFIAQTKPDAPLYYAPSWTVAAQTPSVPVAIPTAPPGTALAPTVSTPLTTTPPVVSGTVPPPNDPTAAAIANDPTLQAYIQALMSQGATQQQAFNAAMQSLGNAGVKATPEVQAAVAGQIAGAGAGLPQWALYAAAGVALMFALARPAHRK